MDKLSTEHQLRLDFGYRGNLEFEHADKPEVLAKIYETPFEEMVSQ